METFWWKLFCMCYVIWEAFSVLVIRLDNDAYLSFPVGGKWHNVDISKQVKADNHVHLLGQLNLSWI